MIDPKLEKDTFYVKKMVLSHLLLMNESRFPWLILVPDRPGIREIYELNIKDRVHLLHESEKVSRFLMDEYKPDKLNVAALGNVVPQLHIHHIARFSSDALWPDPVWGKLTPSPYSEGKKQDLLARLTDYFL